MKRSLRVLLFFVIMFIGFSQAKAQIKEVNMILTSPEFANNEFIPREFTCEGDNVNPPLIIEGVPANAKTMALIVDDPDAPAGTWVHWVVCNMPVMPRIDKNSSPGKQGINSNGSHDYKGPCPPSGVHRYYFKIYCLDSALNLKPGFNKADLEKAMRGHILDKAELVGLYKKEAGSP